MSERPEEAGDVARWVEKAENDLRNAEYVITMERNCPTDTVCFHCQQCAEKYLKALLLHCGIDFPRTHDLVVLFNLLGVDTGPDLAVADILPLNRYSVEARYPDNWDDIDLREASAALAIARKVRDAVRRVLPREAFPEEE